MKLLTQARDLKRRKSRERNALFVVEGIRGAEELLRSRIPVTGALVAPALSHTERGLQLLARLKAADFEVAEVDERELTSAANTDSPQGVLLVARVPGTTLADVDAVAPFRILLLDAVQDPGNAGTIIRTAAAFGVNVTVALPGTVDLWSAKVVRSAMGAQFIHTAVHATHAELRDFIEREGVTVWGAEADAGPLLPGETIPELLALAVGNEGAGLSPAVEALVSRRIGIRMRAQVESLNVAVATGILLHQLIT